MMKLKDRIDLIESRISRKKVKIESLHKDISKLNSDLEFWKKKYRKNNSVN